MFHAEGRSGVRTIVLAAIMAWLLQPIYGQTAAVGSDAGPGHGWAGVGLFTATDDGKRVGRVVPDSTAGTMWTVDAAVFVADRIAVGVDALTLGTVTGSQSMACCWLANQEKETAVLASGRWRTVRRRRIALDAIGGIGAVFQHRDTQSGSQYPRTAISKVESGRSPAFELGIDVPLSLGRHVVISPLARLLFLQRDQTNAHVPVESSAPFAVGFIAGVIW